MLKKILLILAGLITGLFVINFVIEIAELFTVMFISGKKIGDFQNDQQIFFATRNQIPFLAFKLLLSAIVSFIAGFLCALVSKGLEKKAIIILSIIQFFGLIYGMFFTEYSKFTPEYIWVLLLLIIPISIYQGGMYKIRRMKKKSFDQVTHI